MTAGLPPEAELLPLKVDADDGGTVVLAANGDKLTALNTSGDVGTTTARDWVRARLELVNVSVELLENGIVMKI